jgi:DNA (cytosine-5)-methyltransferase 1
VSNQYISLFSGAGGLDLGLTRAGLKPGFMVDSNRYACDTLRTAQPAAALMHADIHDVLNDEVLTTLAEMTPVTLVAGSPPVVGTIPSGHIDPDSDPPQLLYRFMDAVAQARPQAFVMEALPVLSGPRWHGVLTRLRNQARELGYDTYIPVFDAADYGVPQHRHRLFFTGMPRGCKPDTMELTTGRISAGVVIRNLPGGIRDIPCPAGVHLNPKPVLRNVPYAGELLNGTGRVIDLRTVAPVLPAALGGDKTPVIDLMQLEFNADPWIEAYHHRLWAERKPPWTSLPPEAKMRRLSLRECAALQGFPSDYPLRGPVTTQFKLVGNATPPALGEAIGRAILAGLS